MDLLPLDGALILSGVHFSDPKESSIILLEVRDEVSWSEADVTPVPLLLLVGPEPHDIKCKCIFLQSLNKNG